MEKKSIGRFIAALRKANGMTQKELAEQLNVSDKAVSRWERDESAPDLSLIPVIAEIFGVTSDEILRGERINKEDVSEEVSKEKRKKQIQFLLEKARVNFLTHSFVALGIAGAGLLAAMVINFGFFRCHIAFFVACIFYLASIVYEGILWIRTSSAVKMEEVDTTKFIVKLGNYFQRTLIIIVAFFAFSLPLINLQADGHWAINFDAWLMYGAIGVGFVMLAALIVPAFLKQTKLGATLYGLEEKEIAKNRIKVRCIVGCAVAMLVTILIQSAFFSLVEPSAFTKGTVFDNYEDFVKYMETPMNNLYEEMKEMGSVIFDEIYMEENIDEDAEDMMDGYKENLYNIDGELLCSYIVRNESVAHIDYGDAKTQLPITVYTHQQWQQGTAVLEGIIAPIFILLYVLEAGAFTIIYRKRTR